MAKQVETIIEIEGAGRITPFTHLGIRQRMDWHHQFEVRQPLDHQSLSDDTLLRQADRLIGKAISISIKPPKGDKHPEFRFQGIVTDLALARVHGGQNELVISGFSSTILLDDGEHTRSFSEVSTGDIFQKVVSVYPKNQLRTDFEGGGETIPYFVQYKESNWHFLCRLATLYGKWFYYDGQKLVLGKKTVNVPALEFGKHLHQFQIGMRTLPPAFDLQAYGYEENESYTAAAPGNVNPLDGYGKKAAAASEKMFREKTLHPTKFKVMEAKALQTRAKLEKAEREARYVFVSADSDATGLHPGAVVTLQNTEGGKSETYGTFVITAISHTADGQQHYHNWFEAIPYNLNVLPANPNIRPPVCEAQPAVVKENHDKHHIGRLRVQFYWQSGNEMTPWIRQTSSINGDKEGFFFLPEKGEQVMVGFENGNPNRPYVTGGHYTGKARPDDAWKNDRNYIKAIQTRGRNRLLLDDTPDRQQIELNTKDEKNKLVMKQADDGSITIETGKKMVLEARIRDDGEIEIKAKNIKIFARENISLETEKGDISIKSGRDIHISARQQAELKANTKMDVEGGGQLNLEAGVIHLN